MIFSLFFVIITFFSHGWSSKWNVALMSLQYSRRADAILLEREREIERAGRPSYENQKIEA